MTLSRRDLLRGTGAAVLLSGLGAGLTACGASKGTGAATTSSGTFDASLQLSWVPGVEFAGEYAAQERGYYDKAGVNMTLKAGGPNVDPISLVVAGRALAGQSNSQYVAAAVNQGAKLKVIAAVFQKDPTCVMSLASKPIASPADMVGKRIGVQSLSRATLEAFCTVNGVDISQVDVVPVGFDAGPLVQGKVDGMLAFLTNQPVYLDQRGIATENLLLADHGLLQFTDVYFVKEDTLANEQEGLKKMLTGSVQGWQYALANPAAAATIVIDGPGKSFGLDQSSQEASLKAQIPLIQTDETAKNGLLTMSDQAVAANISTLAAIGVKADSGLFDSSLLNEVFNGSAQL